MPTTETNPTLEELRGQRAASAALTAQMVASDDGRRRLSHIARVMRMNRDEEHAEFVDVLAQMGGHYVALDREIEEALK